MVYVRDTLYTPPPAPGGGGGGGAPDPHAVSHEDGGSDEVTVNSTDVFDTAAGQTQAAYNLALGNALDDVVTSTMIDAVGELFVGTAPDEVSTIGVGTDGQVLTADSGAGEGLAWGSVSSDFVDFPAVPAGGLAAGTGTEQVEVIVGNLITAFGAIAGIEGAIGALEGADTVTDGRLDTLETDVPGKLTKASNLSDLVNFTTARVNLGIPLLVQFHVAGVLTVGPLKQRWVLEDFLPGGNTWTIHRVRAAADTAPTGADLIVDVNLDGTTVFTTQANRPTVTDGTNVALEAIPDVTATAAADVLTVDIDQVGSGVAGADLTVAVWLTAA